MEAEATPSAVKMPRLGSLILTHSWDGQYQGLKEFAPEDRPNVPIVFWSFRVMVGLGMLMLLLAVLGAWLRWRKGLYGSRAFLRFATWMGPSGLIAVLAGWFTTEVGRQPWIVYGVMRTKDAVSNHSAEVLGATLVIFVIAYLAVFGIGVRYMLKLVGQGPQPHEDANDADVPTNRPARPLSAAPDAPDANSPTHH